MRRACQPLPYRSSTRDTGHARRRRDACRGGRDLVHRTEPARRRADHLSDDAARFAGDKIDGPLTAYTEAETIERHALKASGGKTYAELGTDDPARQTVMTASFLRASLFTSVVSFGVAAMAMGHWCP
jgi:hypothetical protein